MRMHGRSIGSSVRGMPGYLAHVFIIDKETDGQVVMMKLIELLLSAYEIQ